MEQLTSSAVLQSHTRLLTVAQAIRVYGFDFAFLSRLVGLGVLHQHRVGDGVYYNREELDMVALTVERVNPGARSGS